MPGEYAGHLRADDPLHAYLSHQVLPNMGVTARPVDFRVFCLKETKVYRDEEKQELWARCLAAPLPHGN
jgi:hypothetical protein